MSKPAVSPRDLESIRGEFAVAAAAAASFAS